MARLTEREIKKAIKKIGAQYETKIREALEGVEQDYSDLVAEIYAHGPSGYTDAISWIAGKAASNDINSSVVQLRRLG